MKICVYGPSRGGEEQPQVFYLGARRLPVVAIIGRWLDGGHRCYEVSVDDGRRFVLRHEPATGRWELAAVYRAGQAPARARTQTQPQA
jgi:hypothetical protein